MTNALHDIQQDEPAPIWALVLMTLVALPGWVVLIIVTAIAVPWTYGVITFAARLLT